MHYRRAHARGGTYFFTVNLAERNKALLLDHIEILWDEFARVKNRYPLKIDGIVIMPDHIHSIWTLPENDADYSTRWRLIKSGFSRRLPKTESINVARQRKNERGIWQRRFWEHQIRDDNDFNRHMDYMYYNPVKHGYVTSVKEWPYSSFHRDVAAGVFSEDWGSEIDPSLNFGERD